MKQNFISNVDRYVNCLKENFLSNFGKRLEEDCIEKVKILLNILLADRIVTQFTVKDNLLLSCSDIFNESPVKNKIKKVGELLSSDLILNLTELDELESDDPRFIIVSDEEYSIFKLEISNVNFIDTKLWLELDHLGWIFSSNFCFTENASLDIVFLIKQNNNQSSILYRQRSKRKRSNTNVKISSKKGNSAEKRINIKKYLEIIKNKNEGLNDQILNVYKRKFPVKTLNEKILLNSEKKNVPWIDKINALMCEFYNIEELTPGTTSRVTNKIRFFYENEYFDLLFYIIKALLDIKAYEFNYKHDEEKLLREVEKSISIKDENYDNSDISFLTKMVFIFPEYIAFQKKIIQYHDDEDRTYIDFANLPKKISLSFVKFINSKYSGILENIFLFSNAIKIFNEKIYNVRIVIKKINFQLKTTKKKRKKN